jgi:hypothetical protein
MSLDLTLIWAVLIATAVFLYLPSLSGLGIRTGGERRGRGNAGGAHRLTGGQTRLVRSRGLIEEVQKEPDAGPEHDEVGWVVTESGRQPFTVYGLLRTADSVSPIAAPAVATSLAAFAVVYFVVFGAGIWFLLHPYTVKGWRPDSVTTQPAVTATRPDGPIATAQRCSHRDV